MNYFEIFINSANILGCFILFPIMINMLRMMDSMSKYKTQDTSDVYLLCDRIEDLLNRMEQISSNNNKLDYESLNIHEILNHCKRVAENSFGNEINFINEFDPSLPRLFANKNLLIQIIINLLKNATEASQKKEILRLKRVLIQTRLHLLVKKIFLFSYHFK